MTRVAGLLFFLTAAGAALFLFHIKQEVREMEQEINIVDRDILRHQEVIRVLKTEWSYLNRPARIADLAGRHLDLQPVTAQQFVRLEDLPARSAHTQSAAAPAVPGATPTLAPTLAKAHASHKDPRKNTALTETGRVQ